MTKTITSAQEKNLHKSISVADKGMTLLQMYEEHSVWINVRAK